MRASELLTGLFHRSQSAKTRLQCLWTLDGLRAASPEVLHSAFGDPHPAVREHAVRLSEPFLKGQAGPGKVQGLGEALLSLADDPAIRVRYQLAFTLGEWNDLRAAKALVNLALHDADNTDLQTAVMSSAPRHLSGMVAAVCEAPGERAPKLLDKLLGLAAAMNDQQPLAQALVKITKPQSEGFAPWQFGALGGVLEAIDRRGQSLKQFHNDAGTDLRAELDHIEPLFSDARSRVERAVQKNDVPTELVPAMGLLGRSTMERERDFDLLGSLLQPKFPVEIQRAALASLRRGNSSRVSEILVDNWRGSGPALRSDLLDALFTRREWTQALLGAIERGQIPAAQLGAAERQKLLRHSASSIVRQAEKLFSAVDTNRQTVVDAYKAVAALKGDASHGAVLFQQNCAICHERQNGRPQIGPDLGALADKSVETVLIAILDPNRAVEARYVNYTATTKDDREFTGVIIAETANSITLRSATGEETLLRNQLQQFTSSGLSLMPEGFEKLLQPQDAADLIGYVMSLSSLRADH